MKHSLRLSMGWLHTWAGLVTGWLLCAIFLTGTLSVFREPVTRWMQAMPPLATAAQQASQEAMTEGAIGYLVKHAAKARFWRIELPERADEALRLSWRDGKGEQRRAIDPSGGAPLPAPWGRETEGGRHFMSFHYSLQAGLTGFWIVGAVSLAMLVALVSGVIVHKRIFSDFFTFRPNKGQRSWLDAHNASGVLALPFLFMITLTGLSIFYTSYLPFPLRAAYGADDQAYRRMQNALSSGPAAPQRKTSGEAAAMAPLAPMLAQARALLGAPARMLIVERPGDSSMVLRVVGGDGDDGASRRILNRAGVALFDGASGALLHLQKPDPVEETLGNATHLVMEHLHFARFGGWTMRWLYFISGLAGTALMATGTILYLVKRRQKSGNACGVATARADRCIEAVSIASISGTALACIGYFYGNRLIAADLTGRSAWEIRAFLLIWLATLLHAALRPRAAAWTEQLGLGAVLCVGLPLLNALTTGQHLGSYIAIGDWQRASVELTSVAMGALLAACAYKARSA